MNCSARLWRGVTERLGGGVEVCPTQLRGTSVEDCVASLLADLPPRFAVAGLSLGGVVAMALVRLAPERVARLALLSSNPRPPTAAQRQSWARTGAMLCAGTSARGVQAQLLPELLGDDARSGPLAAEVLRMADDVGEGRLADQLAIQGSRVDERPGLSRVRVPTLLVSGGADALVPRERHEELRALVPGATAVVLPGVGHLTPMEAPDAVARLVGDWLTARG
jgi:pimeloyl-ACP methyl ester carboxylesterase